MTEEKNKEETSVKNNIFKGFGKDQSQCGNSICTKKRSLKEYFLLFLPQM